VQFVQLHLDPYHLDLAFVLQLPHVVDVACKCEGLPLNHKPEVKQAVEERVLEEVADFVDEVPVPLPESHKNVVISPLKDVEVSL
jgi:hypothetical protein